MRRKKKHFFEQRIAELERELERINFLNSLIEKSALPPCESLACCNCKHAVWARNGMGDAFLLGCGKTRKCADFEEALGRFENIETIHEWFNSVNEKVDTKTFHVYPGTLKADSANVYIGVEDDSPAARKVRASDD